MTFVCCVVVCWSFCKNYVAYSKKPCQKNIKFIKCENFDSLQNYKFYLRYILLLNDLTKKWFNVCGCSRCNKLRPWTSYVLSENIGFPLNVSLSCPVYHVNTLRRTRNIFIYHKILKYLFLLNSTLTNNFFVNHGFMFNNFSPKLRLFKWSIYRP